MTSTVFCVRACLSCVGACLSYMRVVELRVHSRARGIFLPSRLARCRARCARRIEWFPDASEFHIAGAADCYHPGGRLLRVYPQHQAPDLSAGVATALAGFRASLPRAPTPPT